MRSCGANLLRVWMPSRSGAAALALLARAAEVAPVVVCLDDVHWLDEASGQALGFAIRRLDADAVAVIVASRRDARSLGLDSVAETIEVGGLALEDGRSLLQRLAPIAADVADRVVEATGGLPLAMTEVAAQLDEDQLAGRGPLPDPLPVGGRVLAWFQERFAGFDEGCRLAVAVAAAAGADARAIPLALAALGVDDGSNSWNLLEDAEDTGLIVVDRDGVRFRHPLVRSAALSVLSASDRRRVHAALAEVSDDPERRAAHLVASAAGVSAPLGDALEAAATQVGNRLGSLGGAGIWRDAAVLTPQGPSRLTRLRRAVSELAAAGRVGDALRLADEVVATSDDLVARVEVTVVATWIQLYTDRGLAAAEDAVAEAVRIEGTAPELARQLRMVAAIGLLVNAPIERSLALADPGNPGPDISTLGPTLESTYAATILGLAGRVVDANRWVPPERVALCASVVSGGQLPLQVAVGAQLMALALLWLERPAETARIASSAIEVLQAHRQPQELPIFYTALGESYFWMGRWDEATAAIEQSLNLADQTGQQGVLAITRASSARMFTMRGDLSRSISNSQLALDYAESAHMGPTVTYALHGLGLANLLAGQYDDAVDRISAAARVAVQQGLVNPVPCPFRGDLCEALVLVGDLDQARIEQGVLADQAEETGLRWPAAVSSRVAAMIADAAASSNPEGPGNPDGLFSVALSQWDDGFEGARTRLSWGESLARRGRHDAARTVLAEATVEFARLGAAPFLARAEAAIATTGGRVRSARPGPLNRLTGAELQVAFAVADGLSNRDIATRLFISPKTVEHHLTRAYQKLNARSRTDLARLVLTDRAGAPATSR